MAISWQANQYSRAQQAKKNDDIDFFSEWTAKKMPKEEIPNTHTNFEFKALKNVYFAKKCEYNR